MAVVGLLRPWGGLGPGRSGASPLPHDGRLPEVGPSGLRLRAGDGGAGDVGGAGGSRASFPVGGSGWDLPWLLLGGGALAGALLGRRLALGAAGAYAGAVAAGRGGSARGTTYGGGSTVAGAVYGAGGGHGAAAYGRAEIAGGVERPGLPAAAEVAIGPAPTFLERLGSGLWNVITGTGLEEWGKWRALTGRQRAWLVARGAVNVALWALTPLRLLAVGKQGAVLLGRALGRALPGAVDLLGPVAGKLGAWKAGFQNYLSREAARVTKFLSRFPVGRFLVEYARERAGSVRWFVRRELAKAKEETRIARALLQPGLGHVAVKAAVPEGIHAVGPWLKRQALKGEWSAQRTRKGLAWVLKALRGGRSVGRSVGSRVVSDVGTTGGHLLRDPLKPLGWIEAGLRSAGKRLVQGDSVIRRVARGAVKFTVSALSRTFLEKKVFDKTVSTVRKAAGAVGRGIGAAGRGLVAAARSAVGATRAAARRVSGTVRTVARAARAAAGSVSRAVRSAGHTVAGVAGRAWRTGAGTMSRSVRTVSRGASRVWSSGTRAARRWFTRPAYRPKWWSGEPGVEPS